MRSSLPPWRKHLLPRSGRKSDIPAAGEDIFAEFEKKKQQILNFDIGEQPETERRSKFAGLKFGNDF